MKYFQYLVLYIPAVNKKLYLLITGLNMSDCCDDENKEDQNTVIDYQSQLRKIVFPRRGIEGMTRPKRGEDVDLEALQEAFFKGKQLPSARVIRAKVYN